MIRVLQLIKRYTGNYPLFNEMARLDPARFETVACYLGGRRDACNGLEQWARAHYLERPSAHLRWYNLSLLKELAAIIDRERIQVINCQLHRTTPVGIGAALLSRQKPLVLSTIHGLGGSTGRVRRLQNRLMDRFLYRTVAISHAVAADIRAANPWITADKVVVIQNGLDFARFLYDAERSKLRHELFPKAGAGFWFGTAGRLSAVKDHATLLRAFRKVVDSRPDAVLLIAGRGELEGDLRELSATLGISGQVKFLGFRADMPQVLQCLDCFVFPSLREGLPLALLEAMASRLPVIAAAVGGIPEVFGEEQVGTLIPPGDVEALAHAMLSMTEASPVELQKLGGNARARALGQFRAERMVRQYEDLYAECGACWEHTRQLR